MISKGSLFFETPVQNRTKHTTCIQPDNLVPLYANIFVFIDLFKQSISKEMNNDNNFEFA